MATTINTIIRMKNTIKGRMSRQIVLQVTRHIERVKVPGIKWNDDLVSEESLMSTPSHRKLGPAGKSVLKTTEVYNNVFRFWKCKTFIFSA